MFNYLRNGFCTNEIMTVDVDSWKSFKCEQSKYSVNPDPSQYFVHWDKKCRISKGEMSQCASLTFAIKKTVLLNYFSLCEGNWPQNHTVCTLEHLFIGECKHRLSNKLKAFENENYFQAGNVVKNTGTEIEPRFFKGW